MTEHTDALAIAPGQQVMCDCCRETFDADMFFAFPNWGIGPIADIGIPVCSGCLLLVRWVKKEPEPKDEVVGEEPEPKEEVNGASGI